jgi:hypothetical protein
LEQDSDVSERYEEGVTDEDAWLMKIYLGRRFGMTSAGKAFAITSTGQMALVPPLAKMGDLCVHVRGGYVPLTLRKIEGEERRAELVGACKVQGVDDVYFGEGWEDWSLE